MFPNVECIFSAKWFTLGNLSLLTNFQKLFTVSITVTRHVARGSNGPPNSERCTKNFQDNQGFDA